MNTGSKPPSCCFSSLSYYPYKRPPRKRPASTKKTFLPSDPLPCTIPHPFPTASVADPDPVQNGPDPQHCLQHRLLFFLTISKLNHEALPENICQLPLLKTERICTVTNNKIPVWLVCYQQKNIYIIYLTVLSLTLGYQGGGSLRIRLLFSQ